MSKDTDVRVNDQIRVQKVRLISPDGDQIGIVPTDEALQKAVNYGLDLVEVSPNAKPPVCRIMDYGKYKYEQSKKEKISKKKQHIITVKEIRLRPRTDDHDLETKMRHARKFLEQKNKVKITILFRGREMAYQDFGFELMEKVQESLEDVGKVESEPKMEGRRMIMILTHKN
ncbi:MAG: translation initiation factor IF-3 [Calditrichaeota bacterium]|nr:translation initiation factor IF-3 [Calditrichota bacterium]RQV92835.1 MAG: translation initiation factor IF-3 [bacterium]RQW01050.1 MAG: translation initiation factor IF-3 [Calditrichota bacterium]